MNSIFPLEFSGFVAGAIGALIVGVGFGFFLERAGLGSATRLTGQFYGTDFSVFKVMFTAIVTAMLGVFWFTRLGWLDLSGIYFVPTRVVPQLVGGVIFGIGFVLGGYCPGTSCVAAAAGRGDALVLMGGIFAGLLTIDLIGDPILAWLGGFEANTSTLPMLIGLPRGAVAALVVLLAVAGCWAATKWETRN